MSNDTAKSQAESARRIRTIVNMARREVGFRDVISFGVSTIWSVLFVMGATSAALIGDTARKIEKPSTKDGA